MGACDKRFQRIVSEWSFVMKKKLLMVLITSLIMVAGLGFLVFRSAQKEKELEEIASKKDAEEKDVIREGDVKAYTEEKEFEMKNLLLSGASRNVLVYEKSSTDDIYNTEKSSQIMEELHKIRDKGEYTFEEPLFAWNPFGTNTMSLYMYFKTRVDSYLTYTISVEDSSVPDFTRTMKNTGKGNYTESHEYQITGFVPGMKNYLILRLYNDKGVVQESAVYTIDTPGGTVSPLKCAYTEGKSKQELQNGLYFVYGDSGKNPVIAIYDNTGILRGEIPLKNYHGDGIETVYDNIAYSYSKTGIAEVSSLGQVMHVFQMKGYEQHHDFVYDGYGNYLVLVSRSGKNQKTEQDLILEVSQSSGKVTELIDLSKLMREQKELASSKKKKLNWIGLNSIQAVGVNDIIVSSRELSSIIKIGNIRGEVPSVEYILADKKLYADSVFAAKVLTKSYVEGEEPEPTEELVESILEKPEPEQIPFGSQFGQNELVVSQEGALEEGQYYVYMLNNNYGYWSTHTAFNWSKIPGVGTTAAKATTSSYYKYLVDEVNRVYYLVDEMDLPYSSEDGNVQVTRDGHIIYCQADANMFAEYDKEGKLVRQYNFGKGIYRVHKMDMKNFWYK